MMFDNIASSIEYIRTGKLRALGVTTTSRLTVLPEVPSVGEFVPGYAAVAYNGLGAPVGTPSEIVEKLSKEVGTALADAEIKAQLTKLGSIPMPMTSSEFAKLIADETEKWAKVIKFAGIKAE